MSNTRAAVYLDLFATGPLERIQVRGEELYRILTPRTAGEPVESFIGSFVSNKHTTDLNALADLTFLQKKNRPQYESGPSPVRVVDLFSGCGGMALGVAEACRALGRGIDIVAAYDNDSRARAVYKANFPQANCQDGDLGEILEADINAPLTLVEQQMADLADHVDVLVAGPPCQGHSNLNNHTRRSDPKNALYFTVARAAKVFSPKWIMVENVIAVTKDKTNVVGRTRAALEKLGYHTDESLVDLVTLGVPQTRRRHILVATNLPLADTQELKLPLLIEPFRTRTRSVRWAIEDLLDVYSGAFIDRQKTPDAITQSRIDYLFDHDMYDLPDSKRPDCHRHGDHSYQSVYGRMRWEEPAPTITRGFETMGQGRFVHPRRRRTVTPHEAARLQFFPDFFDFSAVNGSRKALVDMIGNAVPPKLSYAVTVALMAS